MPSLLRVWSLRRSSVVAVCASVASIAVDGAAEEAATEPIRVPPPSAPQPANDRAEREQNVILLLRTRGDEDTIARLRFELGAGGFRIVEARADARPEAEPLAVAAERERVVAAVRVDAARGRVELWVRREDGSLTETFSAGDEPSSAHVLAVRVAEALRARGLLLPAAPGPPAADRPGELPARRAEPPAPAATPRPVPPVRAPIRLSLELGPGLVLAPGGLGPLAVVELGLRLEVHRIWSFSALGAISVSHQSVDAPEGEAEVASALAGGLVELEWARLPFGGLRCGLGAGLSVTDMSGRGSSGFQGADDSVTAFTPLARASFHVDLGPRLRLRTALMGGFTLPEVRIAFGTREVATWGRPFGLVSLALEASPL